MEIQFGFEEIKARLRNPPNKYVAEIDPEYSLKLTGGRTIFDDQEEEDIFSPASIRRRLEKMCTPQIREKVLKPQTLRESFFDYFNNRPSEYKKVVEENKFDIRNKPKAIVAVPVYSEDYQYLEKYINFYASQDVDFNQTALYFLFNDDGSETHRESRNKCQNIIHEMIKKHPQLNINYSFIDNSSPNINKKIGKIRRLAMDIVTYSYLSSVLEEPFLIVSNDIDIAGMNKFYLRKYIEFFSNNSQINIMTQPLDFDIFTNEYISNLTIISRFYSFITKILLKNAGLIITPGTDFAVNANSLYKIADLLEFDLRGEDIEIGVVIKELLGDGVKEIISLEPGIISSGRRIVEEYKQGTLEHMQKQIYRPTEKRQTEEITTELYDLKNDLQRTIDKIVRKYPGIPVTLFIETLRYVGLDGNIDEQYKIKLLNY